MGWISFVIPVKDEQDTLATLCAEIAEVAGREKLDYEIIFVDDGSRDRSWADICRLASADSRIRAVRLRRNFGKAAALSAGFAVARGGLIFTLDADLQDDPHEIPKFLRLIEAGNDFVSGWKKHRHDPWHKVYPSRVFNAMIGALTGLHLHDHVCGFKCFRAEVAREVELYGEMHRFFAVRAFARGFKVAETEVHHRPREHGASKYGVSRFIKGFLDLLTVWSTIKFGRRPMHLLGGIGVACMLLGAALSLLHWGSGLVCVLLGLQFLALGLVAEHRLARDQVSRDPYSVAERIGCDPDRV